MTGRGFRKSKVYETNPQNLVELRTPKLKTLSNEINLDLKYNCKTHTVYLTCEAFSKQCIHSHHLMVNFYEFFVSLLLYSLNYHNSNVFHRVQSLFCPVNMYDFEHTKIFMPVKLAKTFVLLLLFPNFM